MPGFELIGIEERDELLSIFTETPVLARQGFDDRRRGIHKVREFESNFADKLGTNFSLAVSSGTAALRVALASLGVTPGQKVITQKFTFVATVEAIIEAGAIPVCVDIDETLNMDPEALRAAISKDTAAVIAVHMLGTPADIFRIKDICSAAGVPLIEDTAWGLGARIRGQALGTIGDVGTFSFDPVKVITTGEGGMLVTNMESISKKASAWHDHGHENNPHLPRWEDSRSSSGFNYRMSELQGAVGKAQLRKLDTIVTAQVQRAETIIDAFSNVPGVKIRPAPPESEPSYDAVVLVLDSRPKALLLREILMSEGLATKILPEAVTWHFSEEWGHMPSIIQNVPLEGEPSSISAQRLSRCLAISTSALEGPEWEKKIRRVAEIFTHR